MTYVILIKYKHAKFFIITLGDVEDTDFSGTQKNISLFGRLASSGFYTVHLRTQHRMGTKIAQLVPTPLGNNSSVIDEHVPGVDHDVFFCHHTHEDKEDGGFFNPHEASMALGLALYLTRIQGLPVKSVVILTTSKKQASFIIETRRLGTWRPLKHLKICYVKDFEVVFFSFFYKIFMVSLPFLYSCRDKRAIL